MKNSQVLKKIAILSFVILISLLNIRSAECQLVDYNGNNTDDLVIIRNDGFNNLEWNAVDITTGIVTPIGVFGRIGDISNVSNWISPFSPSRLVARISSLGDITLLVDNNNIEIPLAPIRTQENKIILGKDIDDTNISDAVVVVPKDNRLSWRFSFDPFIKLSERRIVFGRKTGFPIVFKKRSKKLKIGVVYKFPNRTPRIRFRSLNSKRRKILRLDEIPNSFSAEPRTIRLANGRDGFLFFNPSNTGNTEYIIFNEKGKRIDQGSLPQLGDLAIGDFLGIGSEQVGLTGNPNNGIFYSANSGTTQLPISFGRLVSNNTSTSTFGGDSSSESIPTTTPTIVPQPSQTNTPTPSPLPIPSPTPPQATTPISTATPVNTIIPTSTLTPVNTLIPTTTPVPSLTSTAIPTPVAPTATIFVSPTPTITPIPTDTPVPDTTAPIISVTSVTTGSTNPDIFGTINDPTVNNISITVNGNTYAAINLGNANWVLPSFLITTPIPNGTYDIIATATDNAGNIGTDSTTNELVVDTSMPMITGSNPISNSTNISINSNISIDFNENIFPISGGRASIINELTGTVDPLVYPSPNFFIFGNTLTITPNSPLEEGKNYYVNIENGLLEDSVKNTFTGLTDSTTINFRTEVIGSFAHQTNEDTGGDSFGVFADNNFVYVANNSLGLDVYRRDGTQGKLVHLDNDDKGGAARGVWSDGNFVYLANLTRGIEVYSVDPTTGKLTHLDNDDRGGQALSVWGDGTYIYLANQVRGIEVYSVNPVTGQLTHVDNDDRGGQAYGVWGNGNFIFLANLTRGVEVYSVNAGTGVLTHLDNDDRGGQARGVWSDGTYIYLANHSRGVESYSVNAGTGALTHINNDDQGAAALGVWGDGNNNLYVANFSRGIESYTTSATGAISHTDNDFKGGEGWGVSGINSFVFLANRGRGLEVYTTD